MSEYIVSARKYRPSTFKDVVGQSALASTLKNAIATGRLAHSYLFCGSRGVGKTSCARIMAKTINCEHPTPDGEACNECSSCRAFNQGNSLNIIELDAASNNGVDDMRALIEQVQTPPAQGHYRVFIIDEVHMLSSQAFNAFLKTLEEPPEYVVFILATTEKHKILPTILSRCQIYDFNRISIQDMIDHLGYVARQERIEYEPSALNIIARKADGAMRDALSIFDQVAASSRGNITYAATLDNLNVLDYEYYTRLLDCFLSGNVMESWLIYKEIRERGFDSQFFINGLADYFRDLMVARDPRTIQLLEAGDEAKATMAEAGKKCRPEFLYRAMDLCNDADLNYRISSNKQFLIELTLAKICQLSSPSPVKSGDGKGLKKIDTAASATPLSSQPAPTSVTPEAKIPEVAVPPVKKVPPATPPRSGHVASRMPRLNSSHSAGTTAQEATAQEATGAERDTPYSDDTLLKAWNSFMENHPKEHILVNTMRASRPSAISPGNYNIVVDNEHQMQLVKQWLPEIERSVRDYLRNDHFTLSVEKHQGELAPLAWNQREVLEHMIEGSPALRDFIRDLNLSLS